MQGSSVMEFEVYGHHAIGRDDYIGGMQFTIDVLLAEGLGITGGYSCSLQ